MAALALAGNAFAQDRPAAPGLALAPGETLLEVAARGVAMAVPDVAMLSTYVVSDGDSADAARLRNAEIVGRMTAAVRAVGVPETAMRTEALRVAPRFKLDKDGDDTDAIIGYRAETRLKVRLSDVKITSRVFDALSSAGATGIEGPDFAFSDDAPLKSRARTAAVAAARAQAEDYARPFGLRVARVLRISERSARVDAGQDIVVTGSRANKATPPVLPGEQELAANVWIDFALAR